MGLVDVFYQWEIQLLVLFSFALQVFLFFTGSLRRRSTGIFLRVLIWTAYLGADWVAVYALGYLSSHNDVPSASYTLRRTQPLAFFWAPFLLIHLGGQDTVTAFAMEDNNLWSRHLLNLVLQVVLALYVFWKSVGRLNMELIVPSVLMLVAGVIKYGERTWSLKCGSSKSLESSTGDQYKQQFPELKDTDPGYSKIVLNALRAMPNVLGVFTGRNLFAHSSADVGHDAVQDTKRVIKAAELELGLMYDDLYTKAVVLRSRTCVILRCISHLSVLAAFALFLATDKHSYSREDTVVTYALFIGGFFQDLCSMFIFMMSPWTWAWLKVRNCHKLASISWFLFASDIGWPEQKPQWSNSMGQYNFLSWVYHKDKTRTCNQQVMTVVRRLANLFGSGKKSLFWMSKVLDTEYVEADEKTMDFVVKGITNLRDEFSSTEAREWPNLSPFLNKIRTYFVADFGAATVEMHMFTEEYLNEAAVAGEEDANDLAEVCRKLSNYMMHLFVTLPSMLPLNGSSEATLDKFRQSRGELCGVQPSKETLEEMVEMWVRLLIYSAGKTQGQMHTAPLASGGELITFVWLLMFKKGLGDSEANRILIANSAGVDPNLKEVFAFYFPH
ncbi:uncharacterized protein LOC123404164 [Hordeum vulgare subsp. vulgare]|uniref:DUF4220 domain-containing protein n=1 Tax=Hordeum vulgare subsp. vulgare TaxID=112509 RepID=A0A8I6X114_HORVV|nr:uncharacterized protein LOC123404164 [Hordeum vulgare subsp. vulgare]